MKTFELHRRGCPGFCLLGKELKSFDFRFHPGFNSLEGLQLDWSSETDTLKINLPPERATTDLKIRMKSSRRGEYKSAGT